MIDKDLIKGGMDGLKKEGDRLTKEVREKVLTYIIAAFGFVAGLAWNEAIKALIGELFPLAKETLLAKFVYAIVITLVVVLVTVYLVRILKREQ